MNSTGSNRTPMRKPAPLPTVRGSETQAAWTSGWWHGKVIGYVLGLGTAVLLGWLK